MPHSRDPYGIFNTNGTLRLVPHPAVEVALSAVEGLGPDHRVAATLVMESTAGVVLDDDGRRYLVIAECDGQTPTVTEWSCVPTDPRPKRIDRGEPLAHLQKARLGDWFAVTGVVAEDATMVYLSYQQREVVGQIAADGTAIGMMRIPFEPWVLVADRKHSYIA